MQNALLILLNQELAYVKERAQDEKESRKVIPKERPLNVYSSRSSIVNSSLFDEKNEVFPYD